ncbi:MAG: tRNA dihydrouridine synthase DusB [Bacteroidota bacterium]
MKPEIIKAGSMPLMLAPMENITDGVYRQICRQHGADIVFTEFISSEALVRDVEKSKSKFDFTDSEQPLGVQIFGHDPQNMATAAQMIAEKNPNFIDLNFGCPVRKVVSKGGGAALLKDVPRMTAIAKAVVNAVDLPVTAKTRLGWDQDHINILDVAYRLQDTGISMLTIHGRTRSQMYGGQANWNLIGEIAKDPTFQIPLIGNGDLFTPADAIEKLKHYPVDGLMIGRAAMGYPWIFEETKALLKGKNQPPPNIETRTAVVKQHLKASILTKGEERAVIEMRKFYRNYFKGIKNFKPFRIRLYEAKTFSGVNQVLTEIEQELKI